MRQFPRARERLFRVIDASGVPGAVLLSGDRHISELSRHDEAAGNPLYEFTSSGLTHHAPMHEAANRHRVGPLVAALNYGLVTIDWAADPVTLRFAMRGTDNETLLDHTLSLSALRPSGGP